MNGTVYSPNKTVYIEDIGPDVDYRSNDRGAVLVCHTDNVNTNCCRSSDNNDNGPIGDWFYPNNSQVTLNSQEASTTNVFVRILFVSEVRLVKRGDPTGPLGLYRCEVSNSRGVTISASIYIMSSEYTTLLDELIILQYS